ncbi:uncharacterized protein LOC129602567 [Paramacrobiotus metropolitanus]|uniref:uncharacterized protein LOC129602567 n=1 Tax=Paramacrobiotus metropolitanus TaxID=2943436 RepID=UPI0024463CA7|nr:uncharacterized protein LOC129602567 [Paramacrobiotus metropolitanus]
MINFDWFNWLIYSASTILHKPCSTGDGFLNYLFKYLAGFCIHLSVRVMAEYQDSSWQLYVFWALHSLILGCSALTQDSVFPPIRCYNCTKTTARSDCDRSPANLNQISTLPPYKFQGLTAWSNFDRDDGDSLKGMILPQQPWCFSYIQQIRPKNGFYISYFGRDAGYPGGTAPPCYEETSTDQDGNTVIIRYMFCASDLCNTITMDELSKQCWTNGSLTRALDVASAATRPAIFSARVIPGFVASLLLARDARSTSSVMRLLTMIFATFALVPSAHALKCYRCKDMMSTDSTNVLLTQNCYTSPLLLGPAQMQECRYDYYPRSRVKIFMQQKPYCATWITDYRLAGQTNYSYFLGRGCVYPGGQPDDCLRVNGSLNADPTLNQSALERYITIQYCDQDFCNKDPFESLVSKCFQNNYVGGTTPPIPVTRDFTDKNATIVTTPATPRDTSKAWVGDFIIQAQIIFTRVRAGNFTDYELSQKPNNTAAHMVHLPVGIRLAGPVLAAAALYL